MAVPWPKLPIAEPPLWLHQMRSIWWFVDGFLIVTHSSRLVTSTSWIQMFEPETSIPSEPPMSAPRMARLKTSPFCELSRMRWNSGAVQPMSVRLRRQHCLRLTVDQDQVVQREVRRSDDAEKTRSER